MKKGKFIIPILMLAIMLPSMSFSQATKKEESTSNLIDENIKIKGINKKLKIKLRKAGNSIRKFKIKNNDLSVKLSNAEIKIKNKNKIIIEEISKLKDSVTLNTNGLAETTTKVNSQQENVEFLIEWLDENGQLTFFGGILILLGLFIEILGAIMVASPVLASKQYKIKSLSIRFVSKDLLMGNTNEDGIFNFVSFFGSLALILGFILQFTGTFLIIPVESWLKITLASCLFISCLLVVLFFMKQSPEQKLGEKISIIIFNLKKIILEPIKNIILRNITCSYCLNAIEKENVYVNYYWENSRGYTYSPYHVSHGHKECLNLMHLIEKSNQNNKEQESKLEKTRVVQDREVFLLKYPEIKEFYKNKKEDYETRIGKKAKPYKNEYEYELASLEKKLR